MVRISQLTSTAQPIAAARAPGRDSMRSQRPSNNVFSMTTPRSVVGSMSRWLIDLAPSHYLRGEAVFSAAAFCRSTLTRRQAWATSREARTGSSRRPPCRGCAAYRQDPAAVSARYVAPIRSPWHPRLDGDAIAVVFVGSDAERPADPADPLAHRRQTQTVTSRVVGVQAGSIVGDGDRYAIANREDTHHDVLRPGMLLHIEQGFPGGVGKGDDPRARQDR